MTLKKGQLKIQLDLYEIKFHVPLKNLEIFIRGNIEKFRKIPKFSSAPNKTRDFSPGSHLSRDERRFDMENPG